MPDNSLKWSHWTREGTFALHRVIVTTSLVWELRFRGERIGVYDYSGTAAASIGKGDHD